MDVVYSSDENYVQHLGVSILSLLENNSNVKQLNIFVISNDISETSKVLLEELASQYRRSISWIDFEPYRRKLALDMEWPIAISAYARLFLPEMLPENCERVLYIDCDTIICDSLLDLLEMDLGDASVAGVEDLIAVEFKERIGLKPTDRYINSGVMLIDIKAWRQQNVQNLFMRFILDHDGKVAHHDQGVINGVFEGKIEIISPRYNAITPFFTFRYNNMKRFYRLKQYYTKEEILEAKSNPVIIHYVPEFVGRVWEKGCTHPKAGAYRSFLRRTVWTNRIYQGERMPIKVRVALWMQKKCPLRILDLLFGGADYDK